MFKTISNTLQWIGRHFLGMLFVLIALVVFLPKSEPKSNANLQEISLVGPIVDASLVIKEIESAQKDSAIKGVLFSINSPGGSVAPSIEIAYAISELSKQKPVVVYGENIVASGGYYSAIWADYIVANPGAIIGSIGVIMQSPNFETLMDKIGIQTQVVKQGAYKEAGTALREWTTQERHELEQLTQDTYDLFIQDVAKARKLDVNNSSLYADARIFSAKRAKSVGLIDEIGTKQTAKAKVASLANIDDPKWKEKNKIEAMMERFATQNILRIISYGYGLKSSF
ncbi:MAG TPA: signal peptide peptidase SppA [Epsilonproteobacteria bacterium]|nr:signal peptide peptidase SppA [Campylobacterota bacterium]